MLILINLQGHHSYIVSIAKLCKENGLFTDVTILCDDGKLLAHKIVLAAVSPFLCHVLEVDTANGHSGQTTIVMPDIRKEIVQQLLDFLYTGIMKVVQSAHCTLSVKLKLVFGYFIQPIPTLL